MEDNEKKMKKRSRHKLLLEKRNSECQAVEGAFKVQMVKTEKKKKHRMKEYERTLSAR